MDTSNIITAPGEARPPKYWANINWSFAAIDLSWLRYWPDNFIRPGGVPWDQASDINPTMSQPDDAVDIPGLGLEVTPVLTEVPLGAPVRLEVKLSNNSGMTFPAPASVSLGSGQIQGTVSSAIIAARSFKSFYISSDQALTDMTPDQSVSSSVTLLRGTQGALSRTQACSISASRCHGNR